MASDRYNRWVVGGFDISLSVVALAACVMWLATAADRLFALGWGWDRQILWIAPIIVVGAFGVRVVGRTIFRAVGALHKSRQISPTSGRTQFEYSPRMYEGYQPVGTVGGRWGCGLAALVGLPLLGFVILLSALGDCVPDAPCHHDLDWVLIAAALGIAAAVGLGSRALINFVILRRTNGS